MNTRFTKVLLLAVVASPMVVAIAMAGDSYLDASSKARGDYGQVSRSMVESRPIYRSEAPVIALTQPAPSAQQRFSYEPRQSAGSGTGKADNGKSNPPNAMAQRETRTYRSYSYEPGN